MSETKRHQISIKEFASVPSNSLLESELSTEEKITIPSSEVHPREGQANEEDTSMNPLKLTAFEARTRTVAGTLE